MEAMAGFDDNQFDLAIVDPNLEKFWGADVYNRIHVIHLHF